MSDHDASSGTANDNLVDKAARSATTAVDATKGAANAALDSVAHKVESVRSTLSPALDNALAPLDRVVEYTKRNPVTALLAATLAGAALSAILRPSRRSRSS